MEYLRIDDIPADWIRLGRHMHLSSAFLQKSLTQDMVRLFSRAKKEGLTTSFDPQWDPDEKWDLDLQALLPLVDVFLPNIEEIKHLTRTDSLEEAIKAVSGFSNIVVVKDGVNGAHLQSNGKHVHQPAFLNPDLVDTIGAGDSFNAGFINRFVLGHPLDECLDFAALIGAISTCKPGGTAASQDLSIARQIARDVFHRKL
jgi:sugar/nucleoside kinase (ribokinase family)